MESDRRLDDALRAIAGEVQAGGRLPVVADVRRRGEARRRRRYAVHGGLCALVAGVAGIGVVQGGGLSGGPAAPQAGDSASASAESLLAGRRSFAVVPASAPESALGLADDGRLAVVGDGDRGRRTFVLVPQSDGTYLVRAAEPGAEGTGACWQVEARGSDPLTVVAAACEPGEPDQRFSLVRQEQEGGHDTYAISSRDAYLQLSATRGPILEELGDAPLSTTFRLQDAGPAPR
ncbi:RICIN domain-containing protein [Micromonospora sp. URMC 105]|uniref:RICIN domain-containing protein n=1 Tax=Micromonospora sp. URMC 105 TaxID=3423413 RepID=UPI003F1B2062